MSKQKKRKAQRRRIARGTLVVMGGHVLEPNKDFTIVDHARESYIVLADHIPLGTKDDPQLVSVSYSA